MGISFTIWHNQWLQLLLGSIGIVLIAAGIKALSGLVLGSCLILGLLSLAYSLPLLPFKTKRRIREYGWLKIVALAGVWTIVTAILPILYLHQITILQYPYEVLQRFVFMFILCFMFDLRDIHKDAIAHIKTLPNTIGQHNSYRLVDAALILFAGLGMMQYYHTHHWQPLAASLITAIFTRIVAIYLRTQSSDRAYLLLGDGMMLLYAALVL